MSTQSKILQYIPPNIRRWGADLVFNLLHRTYRKMSAEETVRFILEHRKSVARYGDGELSLMMGKNLNFQSYHPLLAKKLINTIANPNILVCIPDMFGSLQHLIPDSQQFWSDFCRKNRKEFHHFFPTSKLYGDAHVSRFYIRAKDKEKVAPFVALLRKIWDNRNIVFIEGQYSRLGVGNDLFSNAASIRRILIPSKNAFSIYEQILERIPTFSQDTLFILAAGPTATVLASDIDEMGYQALDLGHIDLEYEWWRIGATERIAIPGKFCNETYLINQSKTEVSGDLDEEIRLQYMKEIIANLVTG